MNNVEWLSKLITFDTTSRNTNLPLIHCIRDWLSAHDIESTLTYDETGKKANLFAALSSEKSGGIILSGHTDVVPVDGQQWDSDPFNAVIKNNRLYGRGASDMKGFIAVILALIPEWKRSPPKCGMYLAFSYDEEVGGLGVPKLITKMQQAGIKPAACIVGEPTNMKPIIAHKGINIFRCRVHGLATHSSLTPQGCNAIEYAAELIAWIRQFANELKKGPNDTCYDVTHTTITTNLISGGNATNIIPSFCEFFFDFRNLPEVKAEDVIACIKQFVDTELLPKMQNEYSQAAIIIEKIASLPAHEVAEEAEITKLVRQLTQENTVRKVSYATEAGYFQQIGIPTLICGPGSIEQAHRANEYIELDQLSKCESFLRQLSVKLLDAS